MLGNFAGVRSFVAILNLSFIRQTTRINSDMPESSEEMHVGAVRFPVALLHQLWQPNTQRDYRKTPIEVK